MASIRTLIARIIGGAQCIFGAVASVFAYLVYANQGTREALSITQEEIPLFILAFLVFSVLSILSGIILIREEN